MAAHKGGSSVPNIGSILFDNLNQTLNSDLLLVMCLARHQNKDAATK
jgi:hypothetical protein